jgi:hypothetical protein
MSRRRAGHAGPGAPGQDRHAEVAGGGHHRGHVGRVTGKTSPIGSIAYMLASRENSCLV